jgi:hypothetical protein
MFGQCDQQLDTIRTVHRASDGENLAQMFAVLLMRRVGG